MPSLLTDLKLLATIERETYQLSSVSASGSSSNVVAASRSDPFYIAVTLSGWANGDGSVVVTGLLSGVTVTSTLAFSGNERRVDLNKKFDELVSVDTVGFSAAASLLGDLLGFILGGSGLDSGTVRVDAVSRTGQPMEELTTIATSVPCKLSHARRAGLQQSTGESPMDSARIFFFPEQQLYRQDRIVVDSTRWQVKGVQSSFRLRDGQPSFKIAIVHAEDQT